jgi:hypothetical protein
MASIDRIIINYFLERSKAQHATNPSVEMPTNSAITAQTTAMNQPRDTYTDVSSSFIEERIKDYLWQSIYHLLQSSPWYIFNIIFPAAFLWILLGSIHWRRVIRISIEQIQQSSEDLAKWTVRCGYIAYKWLPLIPLMFLAAIVYGSIIIEKRFRLKERTKSVIEWITYAYHDLRYNWVTDRLHLYQQLTVNWIGRNKLAIAYAIFFWWLFGEMIMRNIEESIRPRDEFDFIVLVAYWHHRSLHMGSFRGQC